MRVGVHLNRRHDGAQGRARVDGGRGERVVRFQASPGLWLTWSVAVDVGGGLPWALAQRFGPTGRRQDEGVLSNPRKPTCVFVILGAAKNPRARRRM